MKTTSNFLNGDDLKKNKKKSQTKNLFLIPIKFRGEPFLGLAELSKIFQYLIFIVLHLQLSGSCHSHCCCVCCCEPVSGFPLTSLLHQCQNDSYIKQLWATRCPQIKFKNKVFVVITPGKQISRCICLHKGSYDT